MPGAFEAKIAVICFRGSGRWALPDTACEQSAVTVSQEFLVPFLQGPAWGLCGSWPKADSGVLSKPSASTILKEKTKGP